MDNTNEQFRGYLFSTIGFKSEREVRELINNLSLEQSIVFINKSLEYAYSQGVFTMLETEIISKSLSIMSSKIINNNSYDEQNND